MNLGPPLLSPVPRSGDRIRHLHTLPGRDPVPGWLEVVRVGVGTVLVRRLDVDFRPVAPVCEAMTVEGWREMVGREK